MLTSYTAGRKEAERAIDAGALIDTATDTTVVVFDIPDSVGKRLSLVKLGRLRL